MRFGLPDLLVSIVAFVPGCFLGRFITQTYFAGQLESVIPWLTGLVTYLVITSPLYRWFHVRPMLMPRCPHCRHKDRFYYAPRVQPNWPVGELICAKCENRLELWYEEPHPTPPNRGLVRFKLLWPYSFGRWRQLPSTAAEAE